MATPLLLKPSLDEVRLAASKVGLPEIEAEKFWNYYESNGWMVGRVKMVSFKNALAGWRLRWMERNGGARSAGAPQNGHLSGADKMIYQKEFERILDRIRVLKATYGEMQVWTRADGLEYKRLVARKKELKGILGITI